MLATFTLLPHSPLLPAPDMWQIIKWLSDLHIVRNFNRGLNTGESYLFCSPKISVVMEARYKRLSFLIITSTISHSSKYLNSYEG